MPDISAANKINMATEHDIVSYLGALSSADRQDWLRTILRAYPDDAVVSIHEAKVGGPWEQAREGQWFRGGTDAVIQHRPAFGRERPASGRKPWVWVTGKDGGRCATLAEASIAVDCVLRDEKGYVLAEGGEKW